MTGSWVAIAPYLPTYHHAQLGWSALRPGESAPVASLAWLLGDTVAFGALAQWAYQREGQRKFGLGHGREAGAAAHD